MQLEIEESALKNESDNASKQRLQELQEELLMKRKQASLQSRVEQEKKNR